jgi:hypothetical protein
MTGTRWINRQGLRDKGITYTRQHITELIKQGKFPPPVKGLCRGDIWQEDVIDGYVQERVSDANSRIVSQENA